MNDWKTEVITQYSDMVYRLPFSLMKNKYDADDMHITSMGLMNEKGEKEGAYRDNYIGYDAETGKFYVECRVYIKKFLEDENAEKKWTFYVNGLYCYKTREKEEIDLSQIELEAKEKEVTLYAFENAKNFATIKGEKHPYTAKVLDMTPWEESMRNDITVTGMDYKDGVLRIQYCSGYVPLGRAKRSFWVYDMEGNERNKVDSDSYVCWIEKINGENIEFVEEYYVITEEKLSQLKLYGDFYLRDGYLSTTWDVTLEME